jgi:uncharacterized protein YkwD
MSYCVIVRGLRERNERIMFRTVITLLILTTIFSKTQAQDYAPITWDTKFHDFGSMAIGLPYTAEMSFTNDSDEPLFIDNIRTNCQCILPHWSNKEIPPRKKGSIFIVLTVEKTGIVNKGLLVGFRDYRKYTLLEVSGHSNDMSSDLVATKSTQKPKTDVPSGDYGQDDSGQPTIQQEGEVSSDVPGDPFRHKPKTKAPVPSISESDLPDVTQEIPALEKKYLYMSLREKQMIDEINLLRSNPKNYIQYVEEYIQYMEKEVLSSSSMSSFYQEEIETASELINELKRTTPLSILEPHRGVYRAAKSHGEYLFAKNIFGHAGQKNSMPWDRILAEASDLKDGNENLVGGPNDIRQAVLVLLVDTGVEGRGHRKTLLDPSWSHVACYEIGEIDGMPNCWVQNFGK